MAKMSTVRTRKRGKTFSYIFETGKKADGKRKVVEKGGFATRKLAYDAGVAAYNDWRHGNIGIVSENITLKDFMTNWLENVVALNVKPTSLQSYTSCFSRHILPTLGNIAVQALTPAKLDEWMRGLLKAGYSKNTISSVHALIHHALDYAVYPAEIISSNPANYIKVPKKAPTNVVKRHIITKEKLAELLEKYPFGSPYYIPILILYHTGMRIGELCGLTWNDIDFDIKIVTLDKQIVYVSRKGDFFSSLKTESSNRRILVDDFLIEELKRWKNQQAENERILPICTRIYERVIFKYLLTNVFKREGILRQKVGRSFRSFKRCKKIFSPSGDFFCNEIFGKFFYLTYETKFSTIRRVVL